MKGVAFVVLAVHEQVALVSFCYSEMHLLLYVHEQLAMSLHLLCSCSTIYICGYYYVQTTVL